MQIDKGAISQKDYMHLLLNDKVALVTGAGSGIGASIAASLAREGCVVYIADLPFELAQKVEKDLKKEGGKALSAHWTLGTISKSNGWFGELSMFTGVSTSWSTTQAS